MIRFHKVVARDAFGYSLLDFDFNDGINSIEGENGASKTSIFMTLMQGLYNRNAKGTKIDEVNNYVTGLPYEIEVYFAKDASEYFVNNSRKAGCIEIFRNGQPIHVKRIPDNLKIIEDILGADYTVFPDLIYQSPKSSINLLETGSDSSRKAFINKILKLEELDAKLEKAKQLAKEIEGKGGKLELLKRNLDVLYQSADEDYAEVQDELWFGHIESRLVDWNNERDTLKSRLSYTTSKLKELYKAQEDYTRSKEALDTLASLEEQLSNTKCPAKSYDDLLESKHKLELSLKDLNQDIIRNQGYLKLAEEDVAKQREIELLKLECSSNLGTITLEEVESNIENYKKDIAEIAASITGYRKELQTLRVCAETGSCPTCNHTVDKNTFKYQDTKLVLAISKAMESSKELEAALDFEVVVKHKLEHNKEIQVKINRLLSEKPSPLTLKEVEGISWRLNGELREFTRYVERVVEELKYRKQYDDLCKQISTLKASTNVSLDITAIMADIAFQLSEKYKLERELDSVEEYIQDCQKELKRIQEFNSIQRTLKAVNAQKRKHNELIESRKISCRKEIEDLEKTSDLLKIWVGVLGGKGYRVHKVNSFLQHLNSTMDKYSEMLSNGKIKCSFFITEGEIEFTVTDCNKTIAWNCWSEGEKARVKMACLFAILELLEIMGSVSFNVLALDEIFGALDAGGREGLFTVLNYLKNKGRAIYTISHTPIASSTEYDSVIQAVKNDDGTTSIIQ